MQQLDKMVGNFGHHHYMNSVRHDHEFIFNDNHHALEQYCGKIIREKTNGSNNSRGSSLSSNSITNSSKNSCSNRTTVDKNQVHANFIQFKFGLIPFWYSLNETHVRIIREIRIRNTRMKEICRSFPSIGLVLDKKSSVNGKRKFISLRRQTFYVFVVVVKIYAKRHKN